jgi:hypothetical protein
MALRECRGNRPHRGRDVADAFDRRQGELDGAFAAWRQKPFDAKPHGGRVAGKRKFDGCTRQSLGLAREQRGGGECRLITGGGPSAGRVARPALLERAPDAPAPAVLVTAHQMGTPWFSRWRFAAMASTRCYIGNLFDCVDGNYAAIRAKTG